ncbi:MAG: DNA helicase II [Candidatus Dactylopiibacterium carminicum]|uniref:DNA 3'-5' helicase n=1 Tax=Candidatus Dactylopiibacterium carminicum TaxID=857335 RepID=A0A272EUQ1_9RHOO|nr:3'-5' exonuclease [Candidatus Dactylopiibacterium carminicum]KAF7600345.1 DNA helicase II [Candidatus Dactylopiibacterium carminicum]PAS93827.1 MAG: DNA helicase II [Candidatus Dactylopiibacterium carminicum]PAS95621.1 MAG: DNA helicase II [Candidatus Dactylopiibacterium carminicum]PAT00346.1 MAG: DNA helicase II [Candidatus Dactylopiibacterium carminicum]
MSRLLENLNPEQLAAVTLPPQPALILAGAGSGKTRVLTTRIAWLLQTGQATPANILGVTFTNKAAKEMLTRLGAMLPINTRGMWIGTFHGLCNRLLRAHYREAALPQTFQILDTTDQLAAIKRLLKTLNIDDEKFPPRELQHFINGNKEAGYRPAQVEAWDDYTRMRVELYKEYDDQCQREGVVDFPELLLRCYELLSRNEPVRRHYQLRFRHILVDEFQDTNRLQYLWLKLLAGHGEPARSHSPSPLTDEESLEHADGAARNWAAVFAVGDDDQSIYAFRGAEVGNMRDFEHEFGVSRVIRLEQNYRSHGNILDAANAIIANNSKRLGKNLWTDQGSGEPIRVYEAPTDIDEARWIVEEIQQLIRDGASRSDIALLYRSNAQSRVLEQQLFSAGVPYKVYGGLRFFERQEIKHALAYLRLLANPDDDTAFLRVVNFPTRGIGARSVEQLQDAARSFNTSLYATVPHLSGKPAVAIGAFVRLVEEARQTTRELPLPEVVDHILDASGLRKHYQAEREGQERLENLDELVSAARYFLNDMDQPVAEGEEPMPGDPLSRFLAHASLEAGDHQAEAGQDAVQLMTVHAAKGLEFDAVFITGVEDGLFPHEQSMNDLVSLEEERRLMYVAITRARQRLYLTLAQSRMLHGQTRYAIRSRFLDEIPEELMKWLTPRVQAGFGGGARYYGGSQDAVPRSPVNAPVQKSRDLAGLRVGQLVRHAKFGEGVIVAAEGSGQDAKLQINFGDAGMKWLLLGLAKLEPV